MVDEQTSSQAEMRTVAPRQVRRPSGDAALAPWQGRLAGRWTNRGATKRSSRSPYRLLSSSKQSSRSACRLLSSSKRSSMSASASALSLPLPSPSLAVAVNAARGRFPARRAYLVPRPHSSHALSVRTRGRFPAGPRSFCCPSPANRHPASAAGL
jgi:hypothetical protein